MSQPSMFKRIFSFLTPVVRSTVQVGFVRAVLKQLTLAKNVLNNRQFVENSLQEQASVQSLLDHPKIIETFETVLRNPNFVETISSEYELLSETVRLKDYARLTLAERYWLEDALAHKDFVMRALDQKRADEIAMVAFEASYAAFRDAAADSARLPVRREDIYPQLHDATKVTNFDRHYLYHPAWAARILARTRPVEHFDIGSILHFSTILSAFVPVRFYDYRPAAIDMDNLSTGAADLLALPFGNDSIASLSCMHVLEHIGLGRYGEPLDPDGDLKAIAELKRVLSPGGSLLIATPVGRARVQFNAHRVYDHEAFAAAFAPLELVEFALIPEHGDGGLIISPPPHEVRSESYGCGCFWFRKPAD